MPKLLLFAPCDNVLLSGEMQSASLIIVLNQVVFQGPIPNPVPPNAISPFRWCTFSQWEMEDADLGIRYSQKVTLVASDNSEKFSNVLDFVGESGKSIHRVVTTNFGFPVIPEGTYRLKLSYERTGESNWVEVADYPLQISYAAPVAPPIQ